MFYSCSDENFDTEIQTETIAFKQQKHDIDFAVFEKSLLLGRDNFKVNWDSGDIVGYDKKGNKTTIEYNAYLQREEHIESNLFHGKIIYKLVMVQKNKKVIDIAVHRYEPYKSSLNKTPSYNNSQEYDGLKFTLETNGKIRNIEAFEKGNIVSSFQESLGITRDTEREEDLNKEPIQCDPLSFFFNSMECMDMGGQSGGGWQLETTERWEDTYNQHPDGNYIINGMRYFHVGSEYTVTTRWVQVYQENPYIRIYHSVEVDPVTGSRSPLPYNPLEDEDRIINNLTGKAKCVYEALKDSNLFKTTIDKFENSKNYILLIEEGGCKNIYVEGCTNANDFQEEGKLIIRIQNIGYGTLDLASTILHEGIHAEIYKYVDEYEKGIDPENRKELLRYYFLNKAKNSSDLGTTVAQHQYMADKFVKPIAEAIRKLDNNNKYSLDYYMSFGWDGLRNYGYDGYYDNGVYKSLNKSESSDYYRKQKEVLDNTTFNKNCQ